MIADLGPGYRHITYDERARGKSKRSADYSFEGSSARPGRRVGGEGRGAVAAAEQIRKILRNDSAAVAQAVRELDEVRHG